jgi:hypothetical protein
MYFYAQKIVMAKFFFVVTRISQTKSAYICRLIPQNHFQDEYFNQKWQNRHQLQRLYW